MTKSEKSELIRILIGETMQDRIVARANALAFVENCQTVETPDGNYTESQRSALWKYMTMKAEQLNDSGLDIRHVVKPTFNIPWTKDTFHDCLWIPFQKAMFKTDSMRSLKNSQIDPIYLTLERELNEKFQLKSIEFPQDKAKALSDNRGYKTGGRLSVPYPEEFEEPTI